MDNIIEVRGLAKRFSDVDALRGVDFDVRRGELFGFLGPNGAGKTTTINVLTGLARADAGTMRIAGREYTRDVRGAQHLMGVVPDESNLYPELTGYDNLCFCASLYGMRKRDREARARELLARFELVEAAARKYGGYSKGMKRKLTLAAGIMHRPQILFLDEPTTGIDVASARHVRQLIASLKQSGTTIFLTTHYIEEAERLCDRIAFIVAGSIVRTDTLERLLQPVQSRHAVRFALSVATPELAVDLAAEFPDFDCQRVSDDAVEVRSPQPVRIGPLVRFFENRGLEVTEARKLRPSLEEVFVEVTGVELERMRKENEGKGGGA
jgi:ABC-2 type transport system ATP-binding protein